MCVKCLFNQILYIRIRHLPFLWALNVIWRDILMKTCVRLRGRGNGTEKVNGEKERQEVFFEPERKTARDEEEDGGAGGRERQDTAAQREEEWRIATAANDDDRSSSYL